MIDIHAHILPGLDDGPETPEDSLEMAWAFVKAGYTTVVATPHVIPGVYDHTRAAILHSVRRFQERLQAAGIPLRVLPGAEYHLSDRLLPLLRAGDLLTLNDTGKYLLVELPFYQIPEYVSRFLFELLLAGVTPIIAHPERNDFLARDPAALAEMRARGILAQVTAGALTGLFGSAAKRVAAAFVREGTAQFIATDAHGPGARLEAGAEAAALLGASAKAFLHTNPAAVVEGTTMNPAAFAGASSSRKNRLAVFHREGKGKPFASDS